jgi:cellulose synthase operon protein C
LSACRAWGNVGGLLEEVVELLGSPKRRRTPKEAPWQYTEAYARLILANGFARLGQHERAIELGAAAQEVLGAHLVASDRVHGFLGDLFFHRLEAALALRPRTQRWPSELVEAHRALDRVAVYKVDRLTEASRTISITGREGSSDPIANWIQRTTPTMPVASRIDDLRTVEEPETRAGLIATLFEQPESDDVIAACIDALTELPYELAVPLLPDVAVVAIRHEPLVQAKACFAIARFGFGELAAPKLDVLRASLPTLDAEVLALVVPPLLRAMRWLGLDAEIAATLAAVLHRFSLDELPTPFRFVIAGALVSIGDVRGTAMIDAVLAATAVLPTRLATVRAIAAGASYADRRHGFAIHRKLFAPYLDMSDSFGTSSHYCLTVLQYIESLVLGICDVELANLNVLEPTSQLLLGSGFAF